MPWFQPNVSGQKTLAEEEPGTHVVRRTEIVVEKTRCSVDIHGSIRLQPGERCRFADSLATPQ
jgi:hypothetical protein